MPSVLPVFLPQAGCPRKCIFCDQSTQTGAPPIVLSRVCRDLEAVLLARQQAQAPPVEVAFYGGTFTALPEDWISALLQSATKFKDSRTVLAIRCSTRPDALNHDALQTLRTLGLDMVELGVQTFAEQALARCGRGHTAEASLRACAMVRRAGLQLGVQLMPGAPGQRPGDFAADIARTVELAPDLLRLYPCLVFRRAPLADIWRRGGYAPWGLERTVQSLGGALLQLWAAGIHVGRIGVACTPEVQEEVLAGPLHPALGAMARSAALFRLVRREVVGFRNETGRAVGGICVPRRYQGEFFGHRGRWKQAYARLGLGAQKVAFRDEPYFSLF